jgi:uncharacterized protein (DUF58 family)
MSSGPGVAALGIAFCLLAAAFGASALYVPGVALVLLVASAETSVLVAARRARVAREPLVASVQERAPVHFTVTLAGRLPFGGGELARCDGNGFEPVRRLPRGPIGFIVRPQRRGLHAIGPSVVRFRDPFGICARSLRSDPSQVLVLPRVEPIPGEHLARIAGLTHGARRPTNDAAGTEVDGLRPYHRGSAASRIHWPTVARTGVLIERQLHAETERLPLVVLDAQRPASIEALDMCVRAAASLCVGLAQKGGCSLLLPDAYRPNRLQRDLGGWPALHARLALLAPGGTVMWRAIQRASIVLLVTASAWPNASPARRLHQADFTVTPFPLAAPVLFAVAGCAVQRSIRDAGARAA